MMDEREDRLDDLIRDAAQDYNAPPPAPRAELWERIQAARRDARVQPMTSPPRRGMRSPLWLGIGIAAILAMGVAIGRLSAPSAPVAGPNGVVANGPALSPTSGAAEQRERGELATKLATDDHLSQVDAFLTEFGTRPATAEFSSQAQDLLSNTRLLLDSKRVADPRTRKLLEDLELVLVQIATIDPKDRRQDLDFIAEGLAQSHLRTRLRNAIPAGSAIRL